MSSLALAPTVVRTPTALRESALVIGGVLLVAAAAQVVIPLPFTPVPITGQTFAALLVGGALGLHRGAASLLVYLAVGALGAPVFAMGRTAPAPCCRPPAATWSAWCWPRRSSGRLPIVAETVACSDPSPPCWWGAS